MTVRGLLLVAVAATLPAGCAFDAAAPSGDPGKPPMQSVRLATYSGHGVAFSYPASWRYRNRGFYSNMTSPVIDLATQPTRDPCVAHTCWFPVRHLRQGGVVVMWETAGAMIDPAHLPAPGVHVKVVRGGCRALGGEEELIAQIVLHSGRIYEATACLRGPGLAAHDREARAMLASARAEH
jgi:hypothetical protein